MISVKEFVALYEEMRGKDLREENIDQANVEHLQANMIDFLRLKVTEASLIFKKFDLDGIFEVYFYKIFNKFINFSFAERAS